VSVHSIGNRCAQQLCKVCARQLPQTTTSQAPLLPSPPNTQALLQTQACTNSHPPLLSLLQTQGRTSSTKMASGCTLTMASMASRYRSARDGRPNRLRLGHTGHPGRQLGNRPREHQHSEAPHTQAAIYATIICMLEVMRQWQGGSGPDNATCGTSGTKARIPIRQVLTSWLTSEAPGDDLRMPWACLPAACSQWCCPGCCKDQTTKGYLP
jgi:hypothetical protein